MSIINRKDLKYDYSWSTQPASKPRTEVTGKRGTPSEIFQREKGENVLSFINEYADAHDIKDKEEALRIERMLYEKLQNEQMTRREIRIWLDSQLAKHA
ncbi:hypothetical protein DYD21_18980 [Rhodohalobacter sp. SW132]|uniref:hypothetical protein n=1 Tax=Rhodohalobacter sp. SW132 TaxID=2293433 RepID=UPI000E2576BF|nr:hypothetical protein [Rhodohalobacter sp. SW132]REL24293.1 hypothetical protein DYD21_18980 [Rhodohalobacter sp. SW132]